MKKLLLIGLLALLSFTFLVGNQTVLAQAKYKEAPLLAELVKAGKLPPVEQRLPEEPLIVKPVASIGQYGGTWHRAFTGIKDYHTWGRVMYEPMLRWPRDPKDPIQPGLAKKWEWSADGKALTLTLRKGLKWSNGDPFTVDDITFWWNDIELDTNITKAPHTEWVVEGKPMELEKVDDVTIKLKFAGPNGLAESTGLAFHGNQWPLGFERFGFFAPRRYLEKFHPKYNKDLKDYKAFEEKAFDYNAERPMMTPWVVDKWSAGATELVLKRNPYYWKTDPEGNQLPYIDYMQLALVENTEALNLLAVAGKLDMHERNLDIAKYPVFKDNAEKGGYHVELWPSANASMIAVFPNQSYDDPKYRELLQNLKFRQALSLAINRDTINEVAYLGQGIPRTSTVVSQSPSFIPALEKYYAEYSPDQAQALLDEIGLKAGADGKRTFEDGSPLELMIDTHWTAGANLDAIELIVENWNKVGLKTAVKTMQRDVFWPRACGNETMFSIWSTDRGLQAMVDPIYQFPFDERSWMAPAFGLWYKSGGKQGEKPTADFQKAMDLYDTYKKTVDPAKQLELGTAIVKISTENLWAIGTVGMNPSPTVIKNNFKNVIEKDFVTDWIIMSPGTQDPCQYYFAK
jgi:peptide/nickel transport system substrate-binding protein